MKRLSIAFFFFFVVFNLSAQKQNLIKTSLIMPLAEVFEFSYERALNTEMSLHLGVGVGQIFFVNPQFRYYLSETKVAPSGSYIAPFALIAEEPGFGGGIMVGHQRIFKDKVSLEANIGPMVTGEGVTVWGGINFGIAF